MLRLDGVFPNRQYRESGRKAVGGIKTGSILGETRGNGETVYFYVGDADASDPCCSPAFATEQVLAAFPDCLILSAGEDSLRDDTENFGMRLVKAGVCVTMQRIPEAMHGFTTNRTPGWERALELHDRFFLEHINR